MALIVTILFWLLVYDGSPLEYHDVIQHGIYFVFVLLDGMIISRIPIRLKQLLPLEGIYVVYLIWTLIHGLSPMGNPNSSDDDPETDDDALYFSLNWKKRPVGALVLIIFLLFLAIPILYILLMVISNVFFKPKYVLDSTIEDADEEKDEEE